MENNNYIVTFCNNKKNSHGKGLIGKIDFTSYDSIRFKEIKINDLEIFKPKGVTGICQYKCGYVAHLQAEKPQLIFLSKNFELQDTLNVAQYKGIHSIIVKDDVIYLAVTGKDKILICENGGQLDTLWCNGTDKDTIHLNSICFYHGTLAYSAFGAKTDKLWASAKHGYIKSIDGKLIAENIWHPHSLTNYKGRLFYCNSTNQSVESLNGYVVDNLPGYSRGLYIDNNLLICGTSMGRLVSHSTGMKISNKSGAGKTSGQCGVIVYKRNKDKSEFLNLTKYATEIYEITKAID